MAGVEEVPVTAEREHSAGGATLLDTKVIQKPEPFFSKRWTNWRFVFENYLNS